GPQRVQSSLNCDEPCDPHEECRLVTSCAGCTQVTPFCFIQTSVDAMFQKNGFDEVFCGPHGVVISLRPRTNELQPVKCQQDGSCPNMAVCKTRIQDGERYCCVNPQNDDVLTTQSVNRTTLAVNPTVSSGTSATKVSNQTSVTADPTVVVINSTTAAPNATKGPENTMVGTTTISSNPAERKSQSLTCSPPCKDPDNYECRLLGVCSGCTDSFTVCILKAAVAESFTKNRFREDFCGPQGVLLYVKETVDELLPLKCGPLKTCPIQSECKTSFTDGQDYCCASGDTDRKWTTPTTMRHPKGPTPPSPTPTFPPYVTYENQTFSLVIDIFTTLLPSSPDANINSRSATKRPLSRNNRSNRSGVGKQNNLKEKPDCISVTLHSSKEEWNSTPLAPRPSTKIPDPKRSVISLVVVLVQISDVECTEKVTFFYMGRILLARGGCSALFLVCFKPSGTSRPSKQKPDVVAALTTIAASTSRTTTPPPPPPPLTTTTTTTITSAAPPPPTGTTTVGKGGSDCHNVMLSSTMSRTALTRTAPSMGAITSMDLLRQLSNRRCVNGFSFNFGGSIAVASRGCRGEFKLCHGGTTTSSTTALPLVRLTTDATPFTFSPVPLTTESAGGCYKLGVRSPDDQSLTEKIIRDKNGNPAAIASVELIYNLSPQKCIKWDTFFYHGTSLFVTGKCWGYFQVCYEEDNQDVTTPAPTSGSTVTTTAPATPTTSKPSCKVLTLVSSHKYPDARLILDSEYRPVNITMVTLLVERSGNRCRPGKGYLVKGSVISARGGCVGDFAVCFEVKPVDGTETTGATTDKAETSTIVKNTTTTPTAKPRVTFTEGVTVSTESQGNINNVTATQESLISSTVITNNGTNESIIASTTESSATQTDRPIVVSTTDYGINNGTIPTVDTQTATVVTATKETTTIGYAKTTTPATRETQSVTNSNTTVEPTRTTLPKKIIDETKNPLVSGSTENLIATAKSTAGIQVKSTTNATPTPNEPQTGGTLAATATPTSGPLTKGPTSATSTRIPDGDMNTAEATQTRRATSAATTPSSRTTTAPSTIKIQTGVVIFNTGTPTITTNNNKSSITTTVSVNKKQTLGTAGPTVTPTRESDQTGEPIPQTSASRGVPPTTTSPSFRSNQICESFILESNISTESTLLINDSSEIPAYIQSMELIAPSSPQAVCRSRDTFTFIGSVIIARNGCSGEFEVCFLDSKCMEDSLLSGAADEPETYTIQEPGDFPIEIRRLTVLEQIGNLPCVEWESFYYAGDKIIVRDGCHALFQICYVTLPRKN
ncbi:hypothetical protein EGW08_007046, partial [Elysia chlorotica]